MVDNKRLYFVKTHIHELVSERARLEVEFRQSSRKILLAAQLERFQ
jgi:hypothetical protein